MKKIVKIIVLALVTINVYSILNSILVPKWTDGWTTTKIIDGFYELEKNSIDALFLGSSEMIVSVSPMQIYGNYGITSYNLATEQQDLLASYYWLKESLKYQKPKVVILDTLFLFRTSEMAFYRKAFDYMKLSSVKIAAANDITDGEKNETYYSLLFPIIQYHDRWQNLTENDFTYMSSDKKNIYKGFRIFTDEAYTKYTYFEKDSSTNKKDVIPKMEKYLEKIVNLCNENNIELILTKIPMGQNYWYISYYNSVMELANKYNVRYIDLNEKTYASKLNIDGHDSLDYGMYHVNYRGSIKISNFFGKLLVDEYKLTDYRKDSKYDEWNKDYELYIK